MTAQQELFYETLNDAIRATVDALGGAKLVGSLLWNDKPIDEAHRHLLDCLNPDRPHRLAPETLGLLLKLARAKDVHTAIAWLLDNAGYGPPQPTEPQDEYTKLQREYIRAVEHMSALTKRMERVQLKVAR